MIGNIEKCLNLIKNQNRFKIINKINLYTHCIECGGEISKRMCKKYVAIYFFFVIMITILINICIPKNVNGIEKTNTNFPSYSQF